LAAENEDYYSLKCPPVIDIVDVVDLIGTKGISEARTEEFKQGNFGWR
jgi:hypothetical protein